jgi:hypothetical protein
MIFCVKTDASSFIQAAANKDQVIQELQAPDPTTATTTMPATVAQTGVLTGGVVK